MTVTVHARVGVGVGVGVGVHACAGAAVGGGGESNLQGLLGRCVGRAPRSNMAAKAMYMMF
jgi:hypothetical protein